ncbi:MAG: pilus assembly protein PilM [Candidatus Baltobacteraceae bacterium]
MKCAPLPLGIDIGAARVRVAHAHQTPQGRRVRAVAVRTIAPGASSSGNVADAEYVGALIEDALAELNTKERRCVCALGEPDGILRSIQLPAMKAHERERASRYEASRYVSYPMSGAVVRLHRSPVPGRWMLGIARAEAVQSRLAALRQANVRPVAIDHESCVLARALPGFDAIVDIGLDRTTLHAIKDGVPFSFVASMGGASVTRAIEEELGLQPGAAEKRKRILGTAGAGEHARSALVGEIAKMLVAARAVTAVGRIALSGNGARLPGVARDLEISCAVQVELPVSFALRAAAYPEDVLRSAAPDWNLAAGLILWQRNA